MSIHAPITQFKDEYFFLSNFYPHEAGQDGGPALTVEHYFQAAKTKDYQEYESVLHAPGPGDAKRLGRGVTLRTDWEAIKDSVMAFYVAKKFAESPELAARLVATNGVPLVEGNTWGDKYWGVDLRTGEGLNHLGIILMSVRSTLVHIGRQKQDADAEAVS